MKVHTKNITLDWENEKLSNITYKGKLLIKNIEYNDTLIENIKMMANDYGKFRYVSDILEKVKWKTSFKNKKKNITLFINGEFIDQQIVLRVNFIIVISDEEINIQSLISSNTTIVYNIQSNITFDPNAVLNEVNEMITVTEETENAKIYSTYTPLLKDNKVTFATTIPKNFIQLRKNWLVGNNNKRFNVIKILWQ